MESSPYIIRILVVLLAGILLTMDGYAQRRLKRWPCMTRFAARHTVWGTLNAKSSTVISGVSPTMPKGCRCDNTVIVDVLIDKNGRVVCARFKKGHPLLRDSAVEAVKKWTFRPILLSGTPVFAYAHLELKFSEFDENKNPSNPF